MEKEEEKVSLQSKALLMKQLQQNNNLMFDKFLSAQKLESAGVLKLEAKDRYQTFLKEQQYRREQEEGEQRDEIMNNFRHQMQSIMSNYYERQNEILTKSTEERYQQRQAKIQREFEEKQRKLRERQEQQAERNLLCQKKEKNFIQENFELLGLTQEQGEGDVDQVMRVIEMKRKFGKLLQMKLQREAHCQGLPMDIWYVVIGYVDVLGALKLEKTCPYLYLYLNKLCNQCDHDNLRQRDFCNQSFWARNCDLFLFGKEYSQSSCKVQKCLLSRRILFDIAPQKLLDLRSSTCFKNSHFLKQIGNQKQLALACELCSKKFLQTEYCGMICKQHKKYNLRCLYKNPPNGKPVKHQCYCICCVPGKNNNEAMKELAMKIGFYLGLKKEVIGITFKDQGVQGLMSSKKGTTAVEIQFKVEY